MSSTPTVNGHLRSSRQSSAGAASSKSLKTVVPIATAAAGPSAAPPVELDLERLAQSYALPTYSTSLPESSLATGCTDVDRRPTSSVPFQLKYEALEQVGKGAFSTVWKVRLRQPSTAKKATVSAEGTQGGTGVLTSLDVFDVNGSQPRRPFHPSISSSAEFLSSSRAISAQVSPGHSLSLVHPTAAFEAGVAAAATAQDTAIIASGESESKAEVPKRSRDRSHSIVSLDIDTSRSSEEKFTAFQKSNCRSQDQQPQPRAKYFAAKFISIESAVAGNASKPQTPLSSPGGASASATSALAPIQALPSANKPEKGFNAEEADILVSLPKNYTNLDVADIFYTKTECIIVTEYLEGGDVFDFVAKCHSQLGGAEGGSVGRKKVAPSDPISPTFLGNTASFDENPLPPSAPNTFRLDEAAVATVMLDLFKGLAHLHSNGICHRDVKLENLMFIQPPVVASESMTSVVFPSQIGTATLQDKRPNYSTFHVKLIDFGFSKRIGNMRPLKSCCGSPNYMPPEMLRAARANDGLPSRLGNTYGKEVDLWSAGVVLFVMVFGEYPFHDERKSVWHKRILQGSYAIPSTTRLAVSAGTTTSQSKLAKFPLRAIEGEEVDYTLSASQASVPLAAGRSPQHDRSNFVVRKSILVNSKANASAPESSSQKRGAPLTPKSSKAEPRATGKLVAAATATISTSVVANGTASPSAATSTNPRPSATLIDLLRRLLEVDPLRRITAAEAACHPWVTEASQELETKPTAQIHRTTSIESTAAVPTNVVTDVAKATSCYSKVVNRALFTGIQSQLPSQSDLSVEAVIVQETNSTGNGPDKGAGLRLGEMLHAAPAPKVSHPMSAARARVSVLPSVDQTQANNSTLVISPVAQRRRYHSAAVATPTQPDQSKPFPIRQDSIQSGSKSIAPSVIASTPLAVSVPSGPPATASAATKGRHPHLGQQSAVRSVAFSGNFPATAGCAMKVELANDDVKSTEYFGVTAARRRTEDIKGHTDFHDPPPVASRQLFILSAGKSVAGTASPLHMSPSGPFAGSAAHLRGRGRSAGTRNGSVDGIDSEMGKPERSAPLEVTVPTPMEVQPAKFGRRGGSPAPSLNPIANATDFTPPRNAFFLTPSATASPSPARHQ